MEILLLTLVTNFIWSVLWMIEYTERSRVIDWYERSYMENGVRYVRDKKPGMTLPVQYAIYRLENGKQEFVRDVTE